MKTSRLPRMLFVTLSAVSVVLSQLVGVTPASAAPTSVSVSGTTTVGSTVSVNSTFATPSTAGTFVLDTEVFNSSGNRVAQFFETRALAANTSTTRSYNWNTAGLTAGAYTFQQGLFNANWAGNISWNASAGSVTLTTAATSSTSWSASATTSGTSPVAITSNFQAPSNFVAQEVILDTEVYNASGTKVAQWAPKVILGANGKATRVNNFTTSGLPAGTYTVKQGVFTRYWAQKLLFKTSATFTVGAATTSTTAAPATTTTTVKPTTTTTTVKPTTTTVAPVSNTGNPLVAPNGFYANPYSQAANQANAWKTSRPGDAALMQRIADGGAATWLGNWNSDVRGDVANVVNAAASQKQTPVFVAYNIPGRDCGSYSAGGASGADAYRTWINSIASGIGSQKAAVVLEPDALAQIDCLSATGQADRYALLKYAVNTLGALSNTSVYLDAGHPGWLSASTMSDRLKAAGISGARGFSLNVSNFDTTSANVTYGEAISNLTGGKHYIVDTSRNGNGSNGEWCNPSGRALGKVPTTNTGVAHADGYIWIKQPGESDGTCNGGPSAGTFWVDYALGLATRAWS